MDNVALLVRAPLHERIFLATADSVTQLDVPYIHTELIRQIKVLVLLGYEVVTAAPFVWQSEPTRQVIEVLSPLVEARMLGLMGRPDISSASEYLAEREYDTKLLSSLSLPSSSQFISEVPLPSANKYARDIDYLSRLIPRDGSVERYFQGLVFKELDLEASPGSVGHRIMTQLPTKFSNIGRRRSERLVNEISALPYQGHFSRATIEAKVTSHDMPNELVASLNLRSTGLYHAANALASDASLFTLRKYLEDSPSYVRSSHQFSFAPENPYLFLNVLRVFGISPRIIDALPMQTLQRLTTDAPEVRAFVSWYKSFVSKCVRQKGRLNADHDFSLILRELSRRRESTARYQMRHSRIVNLERARIDWFLGMLGALVSLKLGFGLAGMMGPKNITKWTLDALRKRCERAINKPLGDFEAMVIREGLRDVEPLQSDKTDSNLFSLMPEQNQNGSRATK